MGNDLWHRCGVRVRHAMAAKAITGKLTRKGAKKGRIRPLFPLPLQILDTAGRCRFDFLLRENDLAGGLTPCHGFCLLPDLHSFVIG
jgi:hypothetical protein